jgi:hypothetical protein
MSTQAQIDANRQNAKASTGTRTEETKAKSARNSQKFGLFATNSCVQPHEREEYDTFCAALWADLAPLGSVEEVTAAEFVRGAWRLRRCAMAEETLGEQAARAQLYKNRMAHADHPTVDPVNYSDLLPTQNAIDRARTSAQNGMRRAKADLDKLQAARAAKPVQQNEPSPEPVAAPAAKRSQSELPPPPRQPLNNPQPRKPTLTGPFGCPSVIPRRPKRLPDAPGLPIFDNSADNDQSDAKDVSE